MIVPPDRQGYLREIVKTVRGYREGVLEQADAASRLYRIQGALDGQQRTLPTDDKRHHRMRENDDIPERHHRQLLVGAILRALAALFHMGLQLPGPRWPTISNRETKNRRSGERRVYPAFSMTSNGVLPSCTTSLVITTSFTSF